MIFRQFLHGDPIAASYLFGCGGHATAAVVDPVGDVERYLRAAGGTGLEIRYVVGDMGRTELATTAEEGARALFESAAKLRALPDHVEIFPGAYSGSVCGRGLSGKPSSTIGFERRFNGAFRTEDRDDFVRSMASEIPPRPPRAEETRTLNLGVAAAATR